MGFADASFLYSETENDLHINAWLGIFSGPAPSGEEFRRLIASKLPLLPRYRQRVRFVPGDIAPPVWVDDTHFNLTYHVRHIALPQPPSDDTLRALFTTLMAQPLDRNKPLWEMWMVEGLAEDRWALISKLHHCMADGVATTDITTTLLDDTPTVSISEPAEWTPEPAPSDAELVQAALLEVQTGDDRFERYAAFMRSLVERRADVDRGFAALDRSLSQPLSIPSLNGPIGPYRRWLWARAALADVRKVRDSFGGTVNDVVLAAVTRAFRDLLLARGEPVDGRTVRSMVPVSVRTTDDQAGNRVSAMYAELPVGIDDPVERFAAVRAQLDGLKESKQALAGDVLSTMAGFQPPMLLALGARLMSHAPSHVNTVTTNVPGPQRPLYALGHEMLEDYPYITLASNIRLATTVFSYNGVLRFGVTGDYETTPDLDVFCEGLSAGVPELLSLANATKPKPRSRSPRRATTQDTPRPPRRSKSTTQPG